MMTPRRLGLRSLLTFLGIVLLQPSRAVADTTWTENFEGAFGNGTNGWTVNSYGGGEGVGYKWDDMSETQAPPDFQGTFGLSPDGSWYGYCAVNSGSVMVDLFGDPVAPNGTDSQMWRVLDLTKAVPNDLNGSALTIRFLMNLPAYDTNDYFELIVLDNATGNTILGWFRYTATAGWTTITQSLPMANLPPGRQVKPVFKWYSNASSRSWGAAIDRIELIYKLDTTAPTGSIAMDRGSIDSDPAKENSS